MSTRLSLRVPLLALVSSLALFACGAPGSSSDSGQELPGSLRRARVAVERPGPLTYFASSLSPEQLAELEQLAPNVSIVQGLERDEFLRRATEAQGVDAHLASPEFLSAATGLRWAQAWSAGVDRYVRREALVANDGLVLTNMAGVHGPAIADHALAMLLALTRGIPTWRAAMDTGTWDRNKAPDMSALAGQTLLVVGLGGIGTEIARRAKGFDMRVTATARTVRQAPAFVDELGVASDLDRLLATANVVAVCVPLTDETRGLFDAERLGLLPDGAILINIARGAIVDTEALLAALESGRLRGACLDVTDPEPLPEDHPLWTRSDVLITPHVAGSAELTQERRWALFKENIRRFGAGEPLLNVVDKQAGY